MTYEERQKIYNLLGCYYPNAKQLRSPATLTAWGYILERYPYDAVKAAVIEYAAHNKFFPDPADLTQGLQVEESDARYAPLTQRELDDMECTRKAWAKYKETNP